MSVSGSNRNLGMAGFIIGSLALLGAFGFQYIGGFMPCELCYAQRVPYFIGLPVLAVVLIFWRRSGVALGGTLVVAGIFAWGAFLGTYHAGVEWGLWPGPAGCSGTGAGTAFEQLGDLSNSRVVPCDKPEFRFLGISFAGYNALISALVVALLLASAQGVFKGKKS
ncbi:MAG: disulfide bond formation protein B [Alphaproteobacteria bacterium]|nr:disulfide bond formation protein B [Alphaproteobacteria bacterium]